MRSRVFGIVILFLFVSACQESETIVQSFERDSIEAASSSKSNTETQANDAKQAGSDTGSDESDVADTEEQSEDSEQETAEQSNTPEPDPEPEPKKSSGSSNQRYGTHVMVALGVGAAAMGGHYIYSHFKGPDEDQDKKDSPVQTNQTTLDQEPQEVADPEAANGIESDAKAILKLLEDDDCDEPKNHN